MMHLLACGPGSGMGSAPFLDQLIVGIVLLVVVSGPFALIPLLVMIFTTKAVIAQVRGFWPYRLDMPELEGAGAELKGAFYDYRAGRIEQADDRMREAWPCVSRAIARLPKRDAAKVRRALARVTRSRNAAAVTAARTPCNARSSPLARAR
jgi:hypothetical protein